jgi:hypothetical protein
VTEGLSLEERRGRAEALRRWQAAYRRARADAPQAAAYFIADLLDALALGDQVATLAAEWLLLPAVMQFSQDPESFG